MKAWKITAAAILAGIWLLTGNQAESGLLLGEPAVLTSAKQIITLTGTADNTSGLQNLQQVKPDGTTVPAVLPPGMVFLATKIMVDIQGSASYSNSISALFNMLPTYAYGGFGYFFNVDTTGSGSTNFTFTTGLPFTHPQMTLQVYTADPSIQPPVAVPGTLNVTIYGVVAPAGTGVVPLSLLLEN